MNVHFHMHFFMLLPLLFSPKFHSLYPLNTNSTFNTLKPFDTNQNGERISQKSYLEKKHYFLD